MTARKTTGELLLVLALLILAPPAVHAAATSKTSAQKVEVAAPEATAKAKFPQKQSPSRSGPNEGLSFNYLFESYLNREKPPAGVPDYGQIGAEFQTQAQGRFFEGTLHLGGSFATAVENHSNIFVPEAYLVVQSERFSEAEVLGDARVKLSVGRKLETWSRLDRRWDMGLWEPLNRFDALRPIDQGLTGVFVEVGNGDLKGILYGSTVFIPEQNGEFRLQNGHFKSSSPWFSEPTDRLILFSESTEVQYDIRTPSTGSVIQHVSGGGLLRYGDFSNGFFAQASYVVKPRNQLATPFEGGLNLTEATSYAAVTIEPKVIYHQLFGGELGYKTTVGERGSAVGASVSVLKDIPYNENPGSDLTYQDLEPLTMISPRVETEIVAGSATDIELGVDYLHSEGGGFVMRGPFASDKSVFGPRVPYREAVALDAAVIFGRGHRSTFTVGSRWLEELSENGSLLMANVDYDFSTNGVTQDWRVSLRADVLGSRLPPNENRGYVSRFRGNDRWMTQLRFLF